MLAAIALFDRYLRNLTRCRQHEVRMIDPVFVSVRHSNYERMKRRRVEKLSDPGFHGAILSSRPVVAKVQRCWTDAFLASKRRESIGRKTYGRTVTPPGVGLGPSTRVVSPLRSF